MNFLLTTLLCVFTLGTFAQSNDEDLLVKYSPKTIKTLKKENIKHYNYLKHCTKNAYYLTSVPHRKVESGTTNIGNINIQNSGNINFHALGIEIKEANYQFFVLNDGDSLLVVKSKIDILKSLKK